MAGTSLLLSIAVFLIATVTVQAAQKVINTSWVCKRPTIYPHKKFNASYDAAVIESAIYDMDPEPVRQILTSRSNSQRQEIQNKLKTEYATNLMEEIGTLYPNNLMTQYVLQNLLMTPMELEVLHLYEAMAGPGTKEHVLSEILCSKRSNREMDEIRDTYDSKYGSLARDITEDTSGDFRDFLSQILLANRSNTSDVTDKQTNYLIKTIEDFNDPDKGIQESVISNIFLLQSYAQLKEVINKFPQKTGETLQAVLSSYFSGDYLDALLSLVDSIQDVRAYYSRRLFKAMDGFGTDDHTLIRIIILRAESDLGCIKDMFEMLYGNTLESWIKGETSGIYEETLLDLVREP